MLVLQIALFQKLLHGQCPAVVQIRCRAPHLDQRGGVELTSFLIADPQPEVILFEIGVETLPLRPDLVAGVALCATGALEQALALLRRGARR